MRFILTVPLDLNELRELLAAINQTDIAELTLKSSDFELTVRRGIRVEERLYSLEPARLPVTELSSITAAAGALSDSVALSQVAATPAAEAAPTPAPAPASSEPIRDSRLERRLLEVSSPMVGTFYRAPGPDEPPFVEVGDRIRKGQTVCIIEAMKLMNELEAEVSGEIVEILVKNGEPVEYGQLLMRVNPD